MELSHLEPKILVVDDEPTLRLTMKARLAANGFAVEEASDGEEALERLREQSFDIVILDINMPRLNGIQVLEAITREYPGTDVVMATSFTDYALAVECLKKGAKDYFVKPIDGQELVTRIRSLLRAQVSERALDHFKNFWRSTVLFDLFGGLNTMKTFMDHYTVLMQTLQRPADLALAQSGTKLVEEMLSVLRGTVELSDLPDGTLLAQRNDTLLQVVLQEAVTLFFPIAAQKGVRITTRIADNLPMVTCDLVRINQVFASILELIPQESAEGDEVIVASGMSSTGIDGQPGSFVEVRFLFPAPGLLSDDALQVLNAPESRWKTITDSQPALLFSLAISKKIIEAHNGSFQASRTPNNETVLRVQLPHI